MIHENPRLPREHLRPRLPSLPKHLILHFAASRNTKNFTYKHLVHTKTNGKRDDLTSDRWEEILHKDRDDGRERGRAQRRWSSRVPPPRSKLSWKRSHSAKLSREGEAAIGEPSSRSIATTSCSGGDEGIGCSSPWRTTKIARRIGSSRSIYARSSTSDRLRRVWSLSLSLAWGRKREKGVSFLNFKFGGEKRRVKWMRRGSCCVVFIYCVWQRSRYRGRGVQCTTRPEILLKFQFSPPPF